MTDGLPERLNPENNEYGYSRTMSIFREIAHNGADRICELIFRRIHKDSGYRKG